MELEKTLKENVENYECLAKCNELGHNRKIFRICNEN